MFDQNTPNRESRENRGRARRCNPPSMKWQRNPSAANATALKYRFLSGWVILRTNDVFQGGKAAEREGESEDLPGHGVLSPVDGEGTLIQTDSYGKSRIVYMRSGFFYALDLKPH